jgi:hypothetical protein
MLSNDSGQKPENDATKKLSLSVPVRFGDFVVEGLGDFSGTAGPRDRWTTKLFAGWQHGVNAAGAEIYQRVNASTGVAGADVKPAGVSVFAHHAVGAHAQAVGRVDWTDPDRETNSAGYRELYFVAALDASPRSGVHLMPNALIRTYQAKASALPQRDPDVTLRVTLWFASTESPCTAHAAATSSNCWFATPARGGGTDAVAVHDRDQRQCAISPPASARKRTPNGGSVRMSAARAASSVQRAGSRPCSRANRVSSAGVSPAGVQRELARSAVRVSAGSARSSDWRSAVMRGRRRCSACRSCSPRTAGPELAGGAYGLLNR